MGLYDATAARAAKTIATKGGPVIFFGSGATPTYDPATDTVTGGGAGSNVTGKAVQIEGDPDRLNKLVLTNPVTLLVAASGLAITPENGKQFQWGALRYTIVDRDSVNPDGAPTPILWIITGTT